MISFNRSKSGDLTALYNNIYLHSSYDPAREAVVFCDQNTLQEYSTVLFIEPGLNYCSLYLKSLKPSIKIISVHLHIEFFNRDDISDYKYLFDTDEKSLKSFLLNVLGEMDIERFKVLVLPSAGRLFENSTTIIKATVLQHVKEIHGNITTISGFGYRQIKNFIKNYLNNNTLTIPEKTKSAVLITASGPGLIKSIEFIKTGRENFLLLALPSSVKYLIQCGIKPDLIISTDPGYYASFHLNNAEKTIIIAPYTANIINSSNYKALIPLNQQSFIEKSVLDSNDAFIFLPSNGTVAGSALLFALGFSSGPIIFCGLDFAFSDIKSHVRPHSFDHYLEKKSSRTNTLTNIYFNRNIPYSRKIEDKNLLRINSALSAYRGWFASMSNNLSSRCFFLNSSTSPPGSFKSLNESDLEKMIYKKSDICFLEHNSVDYTERKYKINHFIASQKDIIYNFIKETNNSVFGYKTLLEQMSRSIIFSIKLPELLKVKRLSTQGSESIFSEEVINLLKNTLISLDELNNYVH